jgi:addiction module HigA family antidote
MVSADIVMSPCRISDVVNGNRPITADTAVRLGLFFNIAPRFWMNLQTEYDMRVAAQT